MACLLGGAILLSVIFIGIGGIIFWYDHKNSQRAQASQAWPSVSGVVRETHIDTSMGDPGPSHLPVVEYEYQVGGSLMKGNQISFGLTGGSLRRANEILARYPAGSPVSVYFNPDNPAEAVLERSASSPVVGRVIAVMFAGFGVVLCCASVGVVGLILLAAGRADPVSILH